MLKIISTLFVTILGHLSYTDVETMFCYAKYSLSYVNVSFTIEKSGSKVVHSLCAIDFPLTPYTRAEKFESFKRINSIRETNGNFDACNSCKRLGTSRFQKFESFERINSIRETNGNFDACNSCKRLGTSRLHELHESKFPFVSRIEFIRSKLSNFSAHVYGAIDFTLYRQTATADGRLALCQNELGRTVP